MSLETNLFDTVLAYIRTLSINDIFALSISRLPLSSCTRGCMKGHFSFSRAIVALVALCP